jgi:hypothetical protein
LIILKTKEKEKKENKKTKLVAFLNKMERV